ncbi:hypothetical protein [Erwinia sp. S59]|uniref:hypothetical protein n=1 Tax=Erwinia sp. S59 TaxID=2769340 RepID=UPI00190D844D|nr:hypothetical protein [Erwinia sp. S59]MBK0092802.1 hypothetical protein [Erwinia sp. S59]
MSEMIEHFVSWDMALHTGVTSLALAESLYIEHGLKAISVTVEDEDYGEEVARLTAKFRAYAPIVWQTMKIQANP